MDFDLPIEFTFEIGWGGGWIVKKPKSSGTEGGFDADQSAEALFFSSLVLSSLGLSDTHTSMRLKYEPASEPLHISVK